MLAVQEYLNRVHYEQSYKDLCAEKDSERHLPDIKNPVEWLELQLAEQLAVSISQHITEFIDEKSKSFKWKKRQTEANIVVCEFKLQLMVQ